MSDTFSLQEKIVELDKKDGHILTELALNSRRPFSHLARAVGLSEPALKLRMKKLVGKGVIAGFAPCLDYSRLGLNHYRCLFRLSKATDEKEEEIVQHLLNNKNVFRIARTRWKWDLCVDFIAPDADSFFKLLDGITATFPENLNNYELLASAYMIHFKRRPIAEGVSIEESRLFGTASHKEELDRTDYLILDALCHDARATNHRIGKETRISPATVKKRIDTMEKKGIIHGYGIFVSPWRIGGILESILIKFHRAAGIERRMHEFARSEPSVIYISKTMAQTYGLDIRCRRGEEFSELMKRMKNAFSDVSYDLEVVDIIDHKFNEKHITVLLG